MLLKKFISYCVALLLIGFISFQANKIATVGLSHYDAAYFAHVSKNFAQGHGYATSFHDLKIFDPQIGTGPTIIIPAALFIKIFGNKYWVPGLANSLIILGLLIMVLWMPSAIGLSPIRFYTYCLIVLMSVVWLLQGHEHLWFSLMGEVPSALLAVVSTMILFSSKPPAVGRCLIAGVIAGAAFLTKNVTAFNMIALLMVLPVWLALICKDSVTRKKAMYCMLLFMAGIAVFPASFEAYKKASLSAQDYKLLQVESGQFFVETGSGIAEMKTANSLTNYVHKNISAHARIFIRYVGGMSFFFILIALIILVVAGSPGKSRLHFISYALLISFLFCLIWWTCLAPLCRIRHLYQALIFLSVGIAILITQVKNPALRLAIFGLCILLFIPRIGSFKMFIPTRWEKEERLTALLKTADFIKMNTSYRYVGAGWWVSRELEYILPGTNNFRDYLKLTVQEEKQMKNIALVRDVTFWNEQKNSYLTKLTDACQNIIFHSHPFVVSRIGDPDCYRVDTTSECTNDSWVNGVARSWDTAFFVFDSLHARKELTAGKRITFADGTTRTIIRTREDIRPIFADSTLVIFLDGPPLDGAIVGYPKKFMIHSSAK